MDVTFRAGDPAVADADALIVPVFSVDGRLRMSGLAGMVDGGLEGALSSLAADARFTGKRGAALVVPTLGRLPAQRVVLTGVGELESLTAEGIRQAWAAAAKAAREAGASVVASALPPAADALDSGAALAAASEGARLAAYRFHKYFGAGHREEGIADRTPILTFVGGGIDEGAAEAALKRAAAVVAGVSLARNLVNEPASTLNPEAMAEEARQVAAEQGLEIEVYDAPQLRAMGAGAMTAVGKGSASGPRLIHLVYHPDEPETGARVVGLVGKCITFDTGGYSIKTYEGMLTMKTDMAGGAAVLGAMSALRALGCRREVHGVICAAENMISGEAFRPGDILRALNDVTIEVLSTDAEGRLVLADGLVFAARHGAQELIDLATLTGAAVVALGSGTAALFSNDDVLAAQIEAAAGANGESVWRLPLSEELEEKIRGEVGDVKNSGGRPGGAITAALFLQHFTEGLPWAHLDIAGPARSDAARGYVPKGGTGFGVRTLLAYLTQDGPSQNA